MTHGKSSGDLTFFSVGLIVSLACTLTAPLVTRAEVKSAAAGKASSLRQEVESLRSMVEEQSKVLEEQRRLLDSTSQALEQVRRVVEQQGEELRAARQAAQETRNAAGQAQSTVQTLAAQTAALDRAVGEAKDLSRKTNEQVLVTAKEEDKRRSTFPRFSVGTLTYVQYGAELGPGRGNFNGFDVTRSYLNVTADLSSKVKFRLTPDIARAKDGSLGGSELFRLKYAYVQFDPLPNTWVRVGMHQTPWLDFEESINRYRFQGTMFSEREEIIPGSADLGIGVLNKFPKDYGELNFSVVNGEGFKFGEANKYKSLQSRLTLRPFPRTHGLKGLRLSGFYDLGYYDRGRDRTHFIGFASYETRCAVVTGQYLAAREQPTPTAPALTRTGYSFFAEVKYPNEGKPWSGLAGIVRFDQFDPDRATPDNSHRRFIFGPAYWMYWGRVKLGYLLGNERVEYDAGAGRAHENRLLLQSHIQF